MALYDCVCVASQYSKPTVEYIRKRKPELIFVYLFLFIFSFDGSGGVGI